MAATGFTPISIFYSTTASAVPLAANLVAGELAMNTADGKLFFKDSSGVVQTMASKGTGSIGGSTTQVQFNNAGVLGGSASLTWSGTVLTSSGFAGPLNGTVGATTPTAGSFTTTTIGTSETLSYGTANGVAYLNGSKVVTSGSGLVFDGTNLGVGASSPAYKLDVNGIINGNNSIISRRASGSQPEFVLTQTGVASWSIYNPPSSTDLRFYNGSDLLTLNSSGNLGLGVTPSAWSNSGNFQIGGGGQNLVATSSLSLGSNFYYNVGYKYYGTGNACNYIQASGQHQWYTAPSGTAGNAITFTQAMTLDASGNLGIGTSSPAYKLDSRVTTSASVVSAINLDASGNSNGDGSAITFSRAGNAVPVVARISAVKAEVSNNETDLVFSNWAAGVLTEKMRVVGATGNVGIGTSSPSAKLTVVTAATNNGIAVNDGTVNTIIYNSSGGVASIGTTTNHPVDFYTNNAARMRIDSSGTVLMGQTTNPATATLVLKVPTGTGNGVNAQITSNTGTSYPFSNYNASSTYVGGISCTSSATAFPTSSDVRLKKNITDAPSAISKVLTAKVVSHDWINDGHHVEYGFVAQDLQDTIPQAVIEGTDKEDGSIDMPWGVDYSKIVPLLVKSIQEQQALIQDLTTRLAALEAK